VRAMKYVVCKLIEADSVQEAMRKERKTPVHECYLKDGEEPKGYERTDVVGFAAPSEVDEVYEMRRKNRK
jgi:hypothetical protein